jgi:hypothetical protein
VSATAEQRRILADLMVQGVKGIKVKATFAGMRNENLAVFSDVMVGNTIITHLHVHVESMRPRELKRLARGDRVLLTADPTVYFSPNHPDGSFTLDKVLVKAILHHAKGPVRTFKRNT